MTTSEAPAETVVIVGVSPKGHRLAESGKGSKQTGEFPTVCGARSFGHHLREDWGVDCTRCLAKS